MPKQHHPAVAVIMSVYKSDMLDNFRDAIESILKQDYPNITVFYFGDGPLQSEVNNYIMDLSVRYNKMSPTVRKCRACIRLNSLYRCCIK